MLLLPTKYVPELYIQEQFIRAREIEERYKKNYQWADYTFLYDIGVDIGTVTVLYPAC